MSQNHLYAASGSDILRRLNAIGSRVEAATRRVNTLLRQSEEKGEKLVPEGEPLRHLEEIESGLEAMEERLKKMERQMREKESPPRTFGSTNQFSTGPHFPGLG